MTLRTVAPLDEKQWAQVVKALKEGPTDKSIAAVNAALERANQIEECSNHVSRLNIKRE